MHWSIPTTESGMAFLRKEHVSRNINDDYERARRMKGEGITGGGSSVGQWCQGRFS